MKWYSVWGLPSRTSNHLLPSVYKKHAHIDRVKFWSPHLFRACSKYSSLFLTGHSHPQTPRYFGQRWPNAWGLWANQKTETVKSWLWFDCTHNMLVHLPISPRGLHRTYKLSHRSKRPRTKSFFCILTERKLERDQKKILEARVGGVARKVSFPN